MATYIVPPIPIDDPTNGVAPGQFLGNGQGLRSGPYVYAGSLYVVLQTGTFPVLSIDVFKSSDNGLTWNGVDIGGSANANGNFAASFDGVSIIRVASTTSTIPPAVPGATYIQDFDLTTETWQAPVGGGPTAINVWACQFCELISGYTLVVVGASTYISGQTPIYRGTSFSGGFSAEVDLTSLVAPGYLPEVINDQFPYFNYCMNVANDMMHCVFQVQAEQFPLADNFLVYQQLNQDGTLGNFTSFPNAGFEGFSFPPGIVEFGNNVVMAYPFAGTNELALWVGTPATAPAFTNYTTIDPGLGTDPTLLSVYPGYFLVGGGVLYLIYTVQDVSGVLLSDRIRLLQTTDSATPQNGWTGATVFDGSIDGGPGWTQGDLLSPEVFADINGDPSIVVGSDSTTSGFFILFAIPFGTPAPPPVTFRILNQNSLPSIALANPAGSDC